MADITMLALFVATWAMIVPLYYHIGRIDAKVKIMLNHINKVKGVNK